jgi:general secretion pathway protein C
VHGRGASLGPRGQPAQVDLQLPPLPPPSTGGLPPAVAVGSMARPALPLPSRPVPAPPGSPMSQVPQTVPVPMPLSGSEIDSEGAAPMQSPGVTRPPTVPSMLPSPSGAARPPV